MDHPDEPTRALPEADPPPGPGAEWQADASPEATAVLPAEETPPGPKPLVWIASAALVVALIAGIAWFAVTTSRQNREASMRGTASAYLQALADADASAALDLLAERPADTGLLTDAVLAASRDAAPLSAIEVGTLGGTETSPTVEATYRLGDQPVTVIVQLSGAGNGWKVVDGTVDLTVPVRDGLTVNGVALTEEVNPVFPGTYTASPVSDKVALTGEPTAVVTSPGQEPARIDVTVGLSELGTQTVLGAVKGRVDECLAATESRPVNCPFGVATDGVEVTPGSVRFALTNDPWAGFAPALDPKTLVASGTFPLQLTATATLTRDGLTAEVTTPLAYDRGYAVDLTQDPAVVTWS